MSARGFRGDGGLEAGRDRFGVLGVGFESKVSFALITPEMEESDGVVERVEPTRVESEDRLLIADPGLGIDSLLVCTGNLRVPLRGEGGGECDIRGRLAKMFGCIDV